MKAIVRLSAKSSAATSTSRRNHFRGADKGNIIKMRTPPAGPYSPYQLIPSSCQPMPTSCQCSSMLVV